MFKKLLVLLLVLPLIAGMSPARGIFFGKSKPPTPAAPVNTLAPSVTGDAYETSTLTCATGVWTGYPAPTYTYQWKDNGVDISGATSSTYVISSTVYNSLLSGNNVTCVVNGSNASGNSTASSVGTSVFTPLSLGVAVTAWWDFSKTSSISNTSGSVDSVTDLSGSGYTITSSSTSRPITGTRTINGRNALDFDGSNDNLQNASISAALTTAETIFIVVNPDAYPANANILRIEPNQHNIQYGSSGTTLTGSHTAAYSFSTLSRTATTGVTDIVGQTYGSSVVRVFENGVYATSGSGSTTGTDTMYIGTDSFAASAFNGVMGEIVIFPSVLSTTNMNRMCKSLAAKWGGTCSIFP